MSEGPMAGVLLLAAFVVTVAGMGWLALLLEAHWEQVRGTSAPAPTEAARWRLRLLGSVALLASLGLCLKVDHASMAVLVWVMLVAVAALLITLTLTWRAHWLRWLPTGASDVYSGGMDQAPGGVPPP